MFPLLIAIGPVKVYTSIVFTMIAVLAGGYMYWRKGREEHYPEHDLFDSYLIGLVWAVLWSRIGYVLIHIGEFGFQPLHWVDILTYPGFFPLLGCLAFMMSCYRYARRQKWDEFEVLDFATLSLCLMMSIFWLSNFFSGADLGTPTRMPWGVVFPNVFDKRHPVQLYGSVMYFLLFIYLSWVESRYRTFIWYRAKKDSAQSGFLHCVFCMFLGIFGLILWTFSSVKPAIAGLPIEPVLRVFLVIYGMVMLFRRSGRSFSFRRAKR